MNFEIPAPVCFAIIAIVIFVVWQIYKRKIQRINQMPDIPPTIPEKGFEVPILATLGRRHCLVRFNRMDSGFTFLLFLFVWVPLLNLSWIITEVIRSVRFSRHRRRAVTFLMPFIAVFFFIESIAIDLYILSHARM